MKKLSVVLVALVLFAAGFGMVTKGESDSPQTASVCCQTDTTGNQCCQSCDNSACTCKTDASQCSCNCGCCKEQTAGCCGMKQTGTMSGCMMGCKMGRV
jgi:hypothetical protein